MHEDDPMTPRIHRSWTLCCEPVTQAKMRFFARRIQILKKTSQNLVTIHKNPLSPGPHADTRGKLRRRWLQC